MRPLVRWALLTAVVGVGLRIDFVVGTAMMMTLLAVYAWWFPVWVARRIDVTRRAPRRVLWGETIDLTVTCRNRGRLPAPWVSVIDPVPFDLGTVTTRWVTTLRAGESRQMERRLDARRRGLYRLGPGVVATGDLFGLRRARASDVPPVTTVVYPKIVPVGRVRLPASSPHAVLPVRSSLVEDPHRVVGVRDYVHGDPLRRVHWTATARTGRLLVKEYERGIERTTIFCLDLSRPSFRMADRRGGAELAVTAAASLCVHGVTVERLAVGLRVVAWDPLAGADTHVQTPPRADPAHLPPMLEILARVRPARRAGPGGLLDPTGLGFGATVVLMTGHVDEERALALMRLRRLGLRPSVLEVLVSGAPSEWTGVLDRAGVPVRVIRQESDLRC